MKLSLPEHQGIIDSRLINLEDAVENYKDQAVVVSNDAAVLLIDSIIEKAEALKDAQEALNDAIEQEQIDEAEEEYKIKFGGE